MAEMIFWTAFTAIVTVGFLALIFWRIRKDDAPPDNGGTPHPTSIPVVPDADARQRMIEKRKAQLTKPVMSVAAKIPSPRPVILRPIRRPGNVKIRRKVKKAERQARRRMYELRRIAA